MDLKFTPKKRVLNISYLKSVGDEKEEQRYVKNQIKDYKEKWEQTKSINPLFFGNKDGDLRNDNCFEKLGDLFIYPSFPSDLMFGHIVYSEMDYLYYPGNMYEIMQRTKAKSVNGFPLPESEMAKAYTHYDEVMLKLREYESKCLRDTEDVEILPKLIKNYNNKSQRHHQPNSTASIQNLFNNRKLRYSYTSKNFPGYTDKRVKISNRTKYSVWKDYKDGLTYDQLVKKYHLKNNTIRVICRNVCIHGPDSLFLSNKLTRNIVVDSEYKEMINVASLYLYPHNSVAAVQDYIQTHYSVEEVSDSTILKTLHSLNYSYKSRMEIKRFTNIPRIKWLRKQFAAKMLNYMRLGYELVFFDESPISSQCHIKKCWGQKGASNFYEKNYNAKGGSMLMCTSRLGALPVMIHDKGTNVFVVWTYLRQVLWYLKQVLDTPCSNVVLVMDPHPCHTQKFLLQGLVDEYDLFRIALTPEHSPSMCSQELLNRFIKAEVAKMPLDHSETFWVNYKKAYSELNDIYYVYALQWFVGNCKKSLDEEDLF